MAELESLPIEDVRQIVNLLGEVAGMEQPIPLRRRRLMEGLAKLTQADVWIWAGTTGKPDQPKMAMWFLDAGWPSAESRAMAFQITSRPEYDQMIGGAFAPLLKQHVTRTRQQLIDDEKWYSSSYYQDVTVYRPPLAQ